MVAPAEIIVLNSNTQVWISDVYCLYYNQWYWLRLLPYEVLLYRYLVRDAEFINNTSGLLALTPVMGIPIDEIPLAGICTRSPRRCSSCPAPT